MPQRRGLLRDRDQVFGADVLSGKAGLVEDRLDMLVTVIEQELAPAVRQKLAARGHGVRHHARAQARHHGCEFRQAWLQVVDRDRVQRRDPLERQLVAFRRANRLPRIGQLRHGDLRGRQELPARRRKLHRVARPVDQRGSDPGLQRADAPAEGRLGDVALLGSAREIQRPAKADEVDQPVDVHRAPPSGSTADQAYGTRRVMQDWNSCLR